MAETTHIEWTDATWNIITGCTLVDEGCRHCYAARLAATRLKHHPSRQGLARLNAQGEAKFTGEVRFNDQWLNQPLRWTKPRRIFVCAHGDLFHESVPDDWIDKVFAVMALAPRHTFQVLTKRPDRMQAYLTATDRVELSHRWSRALPVGEMAMTQHEIEARLDPWATQQHRALYGVDTPPLNPLPNVWLGTSISDQPSADLRIPDLLATPATLRFLSAEPLLGAVDLTNLCYDEATSVNAITGKISSPSQSEIGPKIDWLIVGGESGPNARPMHPDWARSLRDQCTTAGVAFFVKQWGEWVSGLQIAGVTAISTAPAKDGNFAHPHRRRVHGGELDGECFEGLPDQHNIIRTGKARAGRLLDGQEWSQMPGAQP